MRFAQPLAVLAVLAVVATACGPRRPCGPGGDGRCGRGPHAAMAHGACGPDACAYGSRCFSNGAIRSNDGVCQACSAGTWTSGSGCSPCAGMMPMKGQGKQPCPAMQGRGR